MDRSELTRLPEPTQFAYVLSAQKAFEQASMRLANCKIAYLAAKLRRDYEGAVAARIGIDCGDGGWHAWVIDIRDEEHDLLWNRQEDDEFEMIDVEDTIAAALELGFEFQTPARSGAIFDLIAAS